MSAKSNRIKRKCRLCLMITIRPKRYELFVKSELANRDPPEETQEDPASQDVGIESKQDYFSKMLLYEKVEYCCGIRLAPKTELPSRICGKCFYMIHMWFNFRQMSCNSQITLESETNIKLDGDAIASTLPQIQKMRRDLLAKKSNEKESELIIPDQDDYKDIEKLEMIDDEETSDVTLKSQSNKQKLQTDEDDCFSFAEEENVTCNSQMDEVLSNTEEQDQDCLIEMCVESAGLAENELNIHVEAEETSNNPMECNKSLDKIKSFVADEENAKDNINCEENYYDENQSQTENITNSSNDNIRDRITSGNEHDNPTEQKKPNTHNSSDKTKDKEIDLSSSSIEDDNLDDSNFDTLDNPSESTSISERNKELLENDNNDLDGVMDKTKSIKRHEKTKKLCRRQTVRKRRLKKRSRSKTKLSPTKEHDEENNLHEPRIFNCSTCGKVHTDYMLHKKHIEMCHKAFPASDCDKNQTKQRYKCKYCERDFNSLSTRHRHQRMHMDRPKYKCFLCQKRFMFKDVMQKHIRTHSGERSYSCGVCNMSFVAPHHLKNHIRSISHTEKQKSYEALGFKIIYETREMAT